MKWIKITLVALLGTLPACNTLSGLLPNRSSPASTTGGAVAATTLTAFAQPTSELDIIRLQILDRMSERLQNRSQGGSR